MSQLQLELHGGGPDTSQENSDASATSRRNALLLLDPISRHNVASYPNALHSCKTCSTAQHYILRKTQWSLSTRGFQSIQGIRTLPVQHLQMNYPDTVLQKLADLMAQAALGSQHPVSLMSRPAGRCSSGHLRCSRMC